jgi:two-component system response regulator FixJ
MSNATLYLVEDDDAAREAFVEMLNVNGFHPVAFGSAEEFLAAYKDDPTQPKCLIVDLRLPGMSGLELQERLNGAGVRMPMIFVSGYADVPAAVHAMKCGAFDFMEKPVEPELLFECINQAVSRDTAASNVSQNNRSIAERMAKLTPREREVLELLATAHSTKEIASRLSINAKTVFVHRARVLEKMGVDNLVELSRMVTKALGGK